MSSRWVVTFLTASAILGFIAYLLPNSVGALTARLVVAFLIALSLSFSLEALFKRRDEEEAEKARLEEARLASRFDTPRDGGGNTRPTPKKSESALRYVQTQEDGLSGWIPKGQSVTVAGRDIGGMVYLANGRLSGRPIIDPARPVSKGATDIEGMELPYWPAYADISPRCRAAYLDWLASGRSDTRYNVGYVFLYFYGLERRFFVDKPSLEEKREILAEVRRLASVYRRSGPVRRYLNAFIQVAEVAIDDPAANEPIFKSRDGGLPLGLKLRLATKLMNGEALTWEWLFSWWICHPNRRLLKPMVRCEEEFRLLFKAYFEAQYPNGITFKAPKSRLEETYRAASSEFSGDISVTVDGKTTPFVDVSLMRSPVEKAQEIAYAASYDLEKLSRLLGRSEDKKGSVAAYMALPTELWGQVNYAAVSQLQTWLTELVAHSGFIRLEELMQKVTGESAVKVTKTQLTHLAQALGSVGFGLAPDVRVSLRAPKLGESVRVFAVKAPGDPAASLSDAFRLALLQVALGLFVVQADGEVSEQEQSMLLQQLDSFEGLSDDERAYLSANLEWLLMVPADVALLRRNLKASQPEAQELFRAILVKAALADGTVQSAEVKGIEKLYKAMDLDSALVQADLQAFQGQNASPEVQEVALSSASASAPDVKPRSSGLDFAKIAAIREDTAQVASILGSIFASDAEESAPVMEEAEEPPEARVTRLPGLKSEYMPLLQSVVTQTKLTDAEFESLCQTHGLRASAAAEELNEWAFETYDEGLFDIYDGYDIVSDTANQIRAHLQQAA